MHADAHNDRQLVCRSFWLTQCLSTMVSSEQAESTVLSKNVTCNDKRALNSLELRFDGVRISSGLDEQWNISICFWNSKCRSVQYVSGCSLRRTPSSRLHYARIFFTVLKVLKIEQVQMILILQNASVG